MKKTAIIIGAGVLSTALVFISCTKDLEQKLPESYSFENSSQVQLFNAITNSSRNYLYIDGKPLNGATIGYGTSFPVASFSAVTTGLHAFTVRDTLATSAQVPLTFPATLQANTMYSIFAYDTSIAPKQVMVPTTIELPFDSTARVRFANMIYSKSGAPANVDIFSVKRNATVFTNIPISGVTPYVAYATQLSDTLIVRMAGTTTQLAKLDGFNPTQKRSYTLVYRGSYRPPTNTTPTSAPQGLVSFANR